MASFFRLTEIAADVVRVPLGFANVYLVGGLGGAWFLIDTGVPGSARKIQEAAVARFGSAAKPQAILLTHGHFDHAGSAIELADFWGVPVLAHELELPYLTGESAYPPADPTAPGFLSFLSRFFGVPTFNLGARVRALRSGPIPGMPGWEWHHTPGHSPGHVSFFRPVDATLIAGDAFATVNLDSFFAIITRRTRISRPPTPFTCDWEAAAASVRKLDALNPLTLACGHGIPMSGAAAAYEFEDFAARFPVPSHGRYVGYPAVVDEHGVRRLPPAPPDRAPGIAGAAGAAALAGIMFAVAAQRRQRRTA